MYNAAVESRQETATVIDELPIFPLPVVLFPGALLPLHVFEDRYKAMMNYAIENEGLFGLSYRGDAEVGKHTPPAVGSVGCAAKISAVLPLDDGRMNILSTGVIRFRVQSIMQSEPFLIARIEPFADDPEPDADLTRLHEETRELSAKFLDVAQALSGSGSSTQVSLPEEPEAFTLFVASTLPIDNDSKQRLLELTSTRIRMSRLRNLLTNSLSEYTNRLRVHDRAKGNGHATLN